MAAAVAARTTRALLRALLAGCLVLVLGVALTGRAYATFRPTGRGSVSGKAIVLKPPVATLTPPPGNTCASTGIWDLRWTLAKKLSFTIYRNGEPYESGYMQENAPGRLYKWVSYVSNNTKDPVNTMFTVSYSAEGWTATSAPVGCKNR